MQIKYILKDNSMMQTVGLNVINVNNGEKQEKILEKMNNFYAKMQGKNVM